MKVSPSKIVIFSVLIMLAPLSFSFLSMRSMMSEGAHWYYTILDYNNYFSDPLFFRYVDFLIQYPALFFLRNFGDSFQLSVTNSIAMHLLSFGWTFHPIASLFVTYRILKKHCRQDLFIFPVLGFFAAFMPASAYAVALALPAMSVFWPVFFCIYFSKGSLKDYIVSTLLMVGLAFCYEPTIVFFILFLLMSFVDLFWLKEKNKNYNIFLSLLSLICIAFLLYVISTVPDKNTGPFWRSLLHGDWSTRSFGIIVTLSVATILFFNFVVRRFQLGITIIATAIFLMGTTYSFYRLGEVYLRSEHEGALGWAYDARSSALPLTWSVAVFCFMFCHYQRDDKWLHTGVARLVSVFVLIVSIATAYVDFNQTREWNFYFRKFQNFVSQNVGCVHLSFEDFLRDYKSPSVEAYSAGYSSVMAQIVKGEQAPIRTLVFVGTEDGPTPPAMKSCPEEMQDKSFQNEWGYTVVLNAGKIVFSEADLLKKVVN